MILNNVELITKYDNVPLVSINPPKIVKNIPKIEKSANLFKLAEKKRRDSEYRVRMSCVIVRGGKPIGFGANSGKWMRITDGWCSRHAEAVAIRRTADPRGADAYIFRSLKNGMPAMARPCVMCMALLKNAGIRRAIYTMGEYPFWGKVKL